MGAGRGWGLRGRLTALLVATLLPLLSLGVYWATREAREKREQVERETREMAARIAAEAGHRVGAVQAMLAVLARLPAVQRQDREEAERLFRELLATSPHLEYIAAFRSDGSLAASGMPVAPGVEISVRDRAWFQTLVRSGKPVAGGFQVGRIVPKPVAAIAAPVLDGQGRILGMLSATLRLAAVSQEVAPAQPRTQGLWAVVDGQGLVLLHGEPGAAVGKPLGPLPGMLRAEAPVPGTPWRAVVGTPEAVVAARVRGELVEIGLPALLILLGAAGVGFWIAHGTWRPLQELAAAVRRIGGGEPGVQLSAAAGYPRDAGGEVGEVAKAFAEAAETLAARNRELAAIALENARLFQGEQERRRQVEAVRAVTGEIARELDLPTLLGLIHRRAMELVGAGSGAVYLWDEAAQVLVPQVWHGLGEWMREVRLRLGETFTGAVAERREGLLVNDYQDSPYASPLFLERSGITAVLGEPLLYRDRLLGVITLHHQGTGRRFTEEDREILALFAGHAAIAIENAQLYGEAERRRQEAEEALAGVRQLQGLLPICAYCKKVRDDKNYWQQVETYVAEHSEAKFSHSICPDCYENIAKPELERLLRSKESPKAP